MKTKILLFLLIVAQPLIAQRSYDVKAITKKLSLDEKVLLLVGTGMDLSILSGNTAAVGDTNDKVPGAAGTSYVIPGQDIPAIVFADGPAGVRINPIRKSNPDKKFYATAFPIATMLASSFNVDLVQKIGSAFGNESKEYGVDILLAPALNIHRNPLGGRNFEYYSEDPLISGKMAAAFTNGVQSQGVGVSIKHFAANNQETNRTSVNTIVSERALREIYLKGFEIAVKESNPWTIMSSYNKLNDVYTSERIDLLTTILRDEWGFKGFVMTDWFGGKNAVEQVKTGNDLLMPGTTEQQKDILNAIKNGSLSLEDVDRNVGRILNIYIKTASYLNYKPSGNPELELHKEIAINAASEGMILLKNNKQTLPLDIQKENIALFGIGSYITIAGGTGSGDVNKAYSVSIAEGLEKAGFKIDTDIAKAFKTYIADQKSKQKPKKMFFLPDEIINEMEWSDAQLKAIAEKNSIGIFTISRSSGEFFDRNVENDFNLRNSEIEFLKKLSNAFHKLNKKVIVLLNIGGVIETASWKNLPNAILLVWQLGQEGGLAIADIVSGKVNPSGKLPMTFPVKYTDAYASKNFPGIVLDTTKSDNLVVGLPSEVVYEEDIFVGYRYFDTYKVTPSFPFGFGLSYTNFAFSGLKTEQLKDGSLKINCAVTNSGKTEGKEVVQVYISAPDGKLKKPGKELKAFAKTKVLKPGEKQDFEFILSPYQLASYDSEISTWITEKGKYKILIGSSIAHLTLSGVINKPTTENVLKTNKGIVPTRKINVLK